MRLSRLLKAAPAGGPVLDGHLQLSVDPIPEVFLRADRSERPFISVRLGGDFTVTTKEDGKVVRYLVTPSGVTNVWLRVVGRLVEETSDDTAAETAAESTANE